MKSLNRPMFRMGGRIINGPGGITAGFNNGGSVRKGYNALTPTGVTDDPYYLELLKRTQKSEKEMDAKIAAMREANVAPDGFSKNDWLRLAATGVEIMGAPSEGSGLRGALASAAPAGSKFLKETADSMDKRDATFKTRRADIDEIELGMDATKYKLAQESQAAYALQSIDLDEFERIRRDVGSISKEILNLDPDAENYNQELARLNNDLAATVGKQVSPIVSGMSDDERADYMKDAKKAIAKKYEVDVEELTQDQLAEAQTYYNVVVYNAALSQLGYDFGYLQPKKPEEKSYGGRVGMAMGGDPDIPNANPTPGFEPGSGPVQDPNQPPIMTSQTGQADPSKLTFQELRARLPMEVSDQVVRLLAASEEALMVFAQIETQQDVANFNQRFQADLKLPEQVA